MAIATDSDAASLPKPPKGFFRALRDAISDSLKPAPAPPPAARSSTRADLAKAWRCPPPFGDFLPARDFDAEAGVFVMDDGKNCGLLFELTPVPTEARTADDLFRIAESLWVMIKDALPEEADEPWVVQFFAENEQSLYKVSNTLREYIEKVNPAALDTDYTRYWIDNVMQDHLKQIADPKGIFFDQRANGQPWSGKVTRLRMTMYRKLPRPVSFEECALRANEVAEAVIPAIKQAGVGIRRATALDYIDWMLPWLSPRPQSAGGDPYEYLRTTPHLDPSIPKTYSGFETGAFERNEDGGDSELPPPQRGADFLAGYDLGDLVLTGQPMSDMENKCWHFDGMPHRVLTLQELTKPPMYGHLTGERKVVGDATTTLLDMMPDGTRFVLTVVIQASHEVATHLDGLINKSKSPRAESQLTHANATECRKAMAAGNKLYPCEFAVYLRAGSVEQLNERTNQVSAILRAQGMRMIEMTHELWAVHKYLQHLPFAYDWYLDRRRTNRCRYIYSSQIARLLPAYGRATGTGKPGLVFFNRGAEPVLFDPLRDRTRNAHALIFGPSGAGKSAFLNNAAMMLMAVHRPRLFILDHSSSFGPLGEFFQAHGLSVNYLQIGKSDVRLNPFADALKLVGESEEAAAKVREFEKVEEEEEDDEAVRDVLTEMEIKTLTMITGGDKDELRLIGRGERAQIRSIILAATKKVHEENLAKGTNRQVIASDVLEAMFARAQAEHNDKLRSMAHAFSYFTGTQSLAGRLFDSQGYSLPEVDVTIVEFGKLGGEGRDAEMILATMTVLDRVHFLVDKHQNDNRPSLIIHDEVHVPLKKPVLSPFIVSIVKLWRKLGAWYWPGTQDFEDVSETAKPLVNNLDWMFALQMSQADIDMLAKFRHLSVEERELLAAPVKQVGEDGIGDYAEAVVIRRPDIRILFRSVMPPLALALAGTEKDEKAMRRQLMRDHNLDSMLKANLLLAERIRHRRSTATAKTRRSWGSA